MFRLAKTNGSSFQSEESLRTRDSVSAIPFRERERERERDCSLKTTLSNLENYTG